MNVCLLHADPRVLARLGDGLLEAGHRLLGIAETEEDGLHAVVAEVRAAPGLLQIRPGARDRLILLAAPEEIAAAADLLAAGRAVDALGVDAAIAELLAALSRLERSRAGRADLALREQELVALGARLDEETAELRTASQRLQRDEAGGERTAQFVAHNLLHPLSQAVAATRLLLSADSELPTAEGDPARAAVEDAVAAGERLRRMIRDVVDVIRGGAGTLRPEVASIDLAALCAEVAAQLARAARDYQVKVCWRLAPEVGRLEADPDLVRRMLLDLVENALRQSRRAAVLVEVDAEEGLVRFAVTDRSGALPEELRHRLFDRYLRLLPGAQQLQKGAGLPFCLAVAEAHGGTVGIEAVEGGARLCVRLPRAAARDLVLRRVA